MRFRLATVSFLNCAPLVEWFTTHEGAARVTLSAALPSRLSSLLSRDSADAALLPIAEYLRGHAAGLVGASGIACRGPVENAVRDILGGVRSTCTYVGASQLKELTKRTTFIRVREQENNVYGKE